MADCNVWNGFDDKRLHKKSNNLPMVFKSVTELSHLLQKPLVFKATQSPQLIK
jgi:hypothetical protein